MADQYHRQPERLDNALILSLIEKTGKNGEHIAAMAQAIASLTTAVQRSGEDHVASVSAVNGRIDAQREEIVALASRISCLEARPIALTDREHIDLLSGVHNLDTRMESQERLRLLNDEELDETRDLLQERRDQRSVQQQLDTQTVLSRRNKYVSYAGVVIGAGGLVITVTKSILGYFGIG